MNTIFPIEKTDVVDRCGQFIGNVVNLLIIDEAGPDIYCVIELDQNSWLNKRYAVVPSDVITKPSEKNVSNGRSANVADGGATHATYRLNQETLFHVATDDDLDSVRSRPTHWFTNVLLYFRQWENALPVAGSFSAIAKTNSYHDYANKFYAKMDAFFETEIKGTFDNIFATGSVKSKQRCVR